MGEIELNPQIKTRPHLLAAWAVHIPSCGSKQYELIRQFQPRADIQRKFRRTMTLLIAMNFRE